MIATIILSGLIFGYGTRVVYRMVKKDHCSDCQANVCTILLLSRGIDQELSDVVKVTCKTND